MPLRMGVRGKLFLVSVALVLAVVFLAGLYLEGQLVEWAQGRAEVELQGHARLVRVLLEHQQDGDDDLDALADRVAAPIDARVTIIGADGRVLGDSEFAGAGLRGLEPHGDRPEVISALRDGQGVARRTSASLTTEMLYVALPFKRPDEGLEGVVRVARPLREVDAAVRRLWLAFAVAGVFAIGGAVLLSALASHYLSRTLRGLVQDARRMVETGDKSKLLVGSHDEIGGLAGSLNRMADELEGAVATLSVERTRFEAVLESMDEGVLALNQHQQLTMINRAALGLLSLSTEHDGDTLAERIPIPTLHELVVHALAGQPERREFETLTTPPRQILASASPLRNLQGAVVVLHDVTEIRRLERIRRDFVANVSHELRTPVSIIRLNAETLLDGALERPDVARKFLEAQMRNADRLAALVSDLLEISRIEAGTYEIHCDFIRVAPIVERIVDSVQQIADEKHMTVRCEVPPDISAWADAEALEHVLLNLVDNAVKYTPPEGKIAVRVRAEGERVRIEVEDNGPGIEPRHRARIFERFYRVDKGRSREVGGTGLGLAIVKHLAEAMDGSVGVEPATPHGSIFWVLLGGAAEPE
ncbi:MAG: HAMP domain-containing protein [Nannocystis sp.]|uniref:ATP-binding protein n=1 Tax=Nannocystis sp. TaxID=1962667 RepID=UPI0024254B6D|nr:ATP-binding protein [Nannocystis sp.]MBK9757175.1 HAMP domain-containing protein [Nannocystis sp.]